MAARGEGGVLLDTHVLLWVLTDDAALGPRARARVEGPGGVAYSAASVWELAIKQSLGKLRLPDGFLDALERSRIPELPVSAHHALGIAGVELPHRDPFDRLLLAQAMSEAMTLLTADAQLLSSGGSVSDARR